ncbi:MAG: tRNA (adenosine(37)-N6)-threonylcarbamoyltransferase complex dimerization subunit type 1 TsaB [Oscillospiraceae bacterium]|nr:tRNA (adenosine(37)-N6)-threonylcarbamoyltransferase complex dimerization subunit type 1 TsaB [Oscillospiraceae bacterium]
MLILGLEASAKAASAALTRDGALLAQHFQCSGLTHSRTLLPMTEDLLKNAGLALADVDAVAVSQGPGSFTGVRIGISTAKGLCWGAEKPAVGVSTLEAMAWNGECAPAGSVICCVMDARRSQVYNALFDFRDGRPQRLCEDRAIALEQLGAGLRDMGRLAYVVGDGAELGYNYLTASGVPAVLAPPSVRRQCAFGVCRAAEGREPKSAAELLPVYLRLSQAERERLAKLQINSTHKGD